MRAARCLRRGSPRCRTEHEANARLEMLADLAGRLLAAGQIELGMPLLEQAARDKQVPVQDDAMYIPSVINLHQPHR